MFICILFLERGYEEDSLIGTTSNMLTLLKDGEGRSTVISCGKQVEITLSQWTDKRSVSCGCYQKDIVSSNTKTHGLSNTPEYKVWQGMKGRCHNPNHADYYNHGAIG